MRRFYGLAWLAMVLALPLHVGTSCGATTACITVTPADLMNGACPDPATAQGRLIGSSCGFSGQGITSVDGSGWMEDGLCCYPVTKDSSNGIAGPIPACETIGEASTGSAMGASSSGGVGGGIAGSTGSGPCSGQITCNSVLIGTAPAPGVCGAALQLFGQVKQCGCASSCPNECDATLCQGNAPDNGCLGCLEQSCMMQLESCRQN